MNIRPSFQQRGFSRRIRFSDHAEAVLYAELCQEQRQAVYARANERLKTRLPSVHVGPIDDAGIQAWNSQWRPRAKGFDWDNSRTFYPEVKNHFEVAVWKGEELAGLCNGGWINWDDPFHNGATVETDILSLQTIEASPKPVADLRDLFHAIGETAADFAHIFARDYICVTAPMIPSIRKFLGRRGFDFDRDGNAWMLSRDVPQVLAAQYR